VDELTRTPTLPEIDEGMSGARRPTPEVTDDVEAAGHFRIYLGAAPGWARPLPCSMRAIGDRDEELTSSSDMSNVTGADTLKSGWRGSRSSSQDR